jgi:hypothetical protein
LAAAAPQRVATISIVVSSPKAFLENALSAPGGPHPQGAVFLNGSEAARYLRNRLPFGVSFAVESGGVVKVLRQSPAECLLGMTGCTLAGEAEHSNGE